MFLSLSFVTYALFVMHNIDVFHLYIQDFVLTHVFLLFREKKLCWPKIVEITMRNSTLKRNGVFRSFFFFRYFWSQFLNAAINLNILPSVILKISSRIESCIWALLPWLFFRREYKEALRQQRVNEGPSVYRPREQTTPPGNETLNNELDPNISKDAIINAGKQLFNEDNSNKRPVQKVTPSRINYQNATIINGSNSEYPPKNGKYHEQAYKKPSSPVKLSTTSILSTNSSPAHAPRLVKTAVGYVEGLLLHFYIDFSFFHTF